MRHTIGSKRRAIRIGLVVLVGSVPRTRGAEPPARTIHFNREVRPVLSNHCFQCHGPDAQKRKGVTKPLRLDTEDGAFADLGGYSAIDRANPTRAS